MHTRFYMVILFPRRVSRKHENEAVQKEIRKSVLSGDGVELKRGRD